jgi:hypothetical protein
MGGAVEHAVEPQTVGERVVSPTKLLAIRRGTRRLSPLSADVTIEREIEMDAPELRKVFERLDAALEHPTELLIRGGAAVLAHGLEQRVTIDIDVLPDAR